MKYFGGCDVGSTYTKTVILDENGAIVAANTIKSKINSAQSAKAGLDQAIADAGLKEISDLTYLIGTGYGRNKVPQADENISEISCHAMGVHVTDPSVRAIFESMANAFEMSLEEFSKLSLTAENVIPITAQCTVFAESEVITLVGEGKPQNEIAAGIQQAVAKRCFVMAKKAGAKDAITLTGGCAKNQGLKAAIEKVLRMKVIELKIDPQLMGALGAAEYARQKGLDL